MSYNIYENKKGVSHVMKKIVSLYICEKKKKIGESQGWIEILRSQFYENIYLDRNFKKFYENLWKLL